MKKLLLLILLPLTLFSQNSYIVNSYIVVEAQYDFYGPTESQFYITNNNGDTILHHVPTLNNEYYIDTLWTNSGLHTAILLDSYGDGWLTSSMSGYFRIWNNCQDTIVEYICSNTNFFATEVINFNLGPCLPNAPPPPPCVLAKVVINLDQFQSETSWEITDTSGNVVSSGSGYGSSSNYSTVVIPVCIPKGDLFFTIYDSYGDGLNGSLWQGQDGSYYIIQCNDTLIYGTDPAFGNDTTHSFVSDSCPPILGCTDPVYVEFNPFASVSDSSCSVLKVFGCTDSTMFNYDSTCNTMDLIDSCTFKLILHDLVGNGWVGSELKLYTVDDTLVFSHTGGFSDIYYIDLPAPSLVTARFFIDNLASLTTIECGFTFINPEGDTIISVVPPFIDALFDYNFITNCGNNCIEKTYGCTDSIAINYQDSVNTDDSSCYYNPGCMNPLYLEYDSTADYSNSTCLTLIVIGCMDSTALNYNSNANVELTGSCITIIYGCMNPLAFNYSPNANEDDSTCVPVTYGCTDITMYNYDSIANTDDGSCVTFVYGCTDSTMFNFNPLANVNDTCVPYVYGCTDPSMFNYEVSANTEDFSCFPYIYGCTDSSAINYNYLANTDNNSCIDLVEGCMDPSADNFNPDANTTDSNSCLYDANCYGNPGNPYWLNDPCYAWVIDVDEYCCDNEWDNICQLTYDYCEGSWTGTLPKRYDKKLIMITDILGRPVNEVKNQLLFYIYNDGTVEKKLIK
mgnify:FL=1